MKNYRFKKIAYDLLKIQAWCEEKFNDKPIYERRLPRTHINGVKVATKGEEETDEQRELRLGIRLSNFRKSEIYKKGQSGEELSEKEQSIYDLYNKISKDYNINTYEANLLKIQAWCEEKFIDKPLYKRRFPRLIIKGIKVAEKGEEETEEQQEVRLGIALMNFRHSDIYKKGNQGKNLTEDEQRIYSLYCTLVREYGRDRNINITGQDIGQASFSADTQTCDEMAHIVRNLVNEKKKQRNGEQK